MTSLVTLLLIGSAGWIPPADLAALFTRIEYRYTGGRYQDEPIACRLFIPAPASGREKLPMIVWLHGYGEGGEDDGRQLKWLELIFNDPTRHDQYPFYFLVVQCPPDNGRWFQHQGDPGEGSADGKGDEMMTIVREVMNKTIADYPIDVNRIYLAGLSAGGSGCWEMAMRYPEVFAAVAPLASRGGDVDWLGRIVDIPLWAFHSADDSPAAVRQTVAVLKRLGGRCHLTEVPGWQHDCWTEAFEQYDLVGWLLSQERGAGNRLAPGSMHWPARWRFLRRHYVRWDYFWPRAVPIAIAGLCVMAWCGEVRRRRVAKAAPHETADGACSNKGE